MTEKSTTRPELYGPGLTDVRMMIVAHTSFRRELGLAPRCIRGVPDHDRRRTIEIADHVELFLSLLHHHHSIEDELLWDRLLDRVPGELEPLVHTMESQHESVAILLEQTGTALTTWRTTATRDDGSMAADLLAQLVSVLTEHLDAEESRLLPIMARHITGPEWAEFTARGMESIPKRHAMLGLGMMLYEGDPAVIAIELRTIPAPLRPVLRGLGRRSFRRYSRRIHGTATPPKGSALANAGQ
jgi:hemerythrin-like domain-containing protein